MYICTIYTYTFEFTLFLFFTECIRLGRELLLLLLYPGNLQAVIQSLRNFLLCCTYSCILTSLTQKHSQKTALLTAEPISWRSGLHALSLKSQRMGAIHPIKKRRGTSTNLLAPFPLPQSIHTRIERVRS